MHSSPADRLSLIRLGALMLLASCLVQPQARADEEEVHLLFHSLSWGMVRGQTVRFNVANPEQRSARAGMLFAQVTLLDSSGAPIAKGEEIAIPPGALRSIDFGYDDLSLAGEPTSGRVQTRAQIRYRSFAILDRTSLIPTSIELLDDSSGHATRLPTKPKEIVVVGSKSPADAAAPALTELPVIVYAERALMGLTHGQTLRVTAVHRGGEPRQRHRPVVARAKLYDANGALLAESVEATLAAGTFHSFDFDRAALSPPGEPISGRLQLRVRVELVPEDPHGFVRDPRATGLLDASLELIDNSTGGTTATVWLTTGFFEVVEPKPD